MLLPAKINVTYSYKSYTDSNADWFTMLVFFIKIDAMCTQLETLIFIKAISPQLHQFVNL